MSKIEKAYAKDLRRMSQTDKSKDTLANSKNDQKSLYEAFLGYGGEENR